MNTIEREPDVCMLHREFEVQLFFNSEDTTRVNRTSYDYTVITPTGVLFSGVQYAPAPSTLSNDIKMVDGLLFWICLRPGDTDQEHFDSYTPEQLEWANSMACEEVSIDLDNAEMSR